ncbi:MAG: carboxy terminal-processing peptidase, partial [Chthoniobacterales bacterium]
KWSDSHQLFLDELKARSAARVAADPEFHYVMEDMDRLRKKIDDNRITLNEDVRKKELGDEKARKDERSKERLARKTEEPSIYRLTLETLDNPKLQLVMYPGKTAEAKKAGDAAKVAPEAAPDADDSADDSDVDSSDGTKPAAIDPERDETLNILTDLVQLTKGPKTASTAR